MRRLLIALLPALALFGGSSAEASGSAQPEGHGSYTDVRIEGNLITITVPLALIYGLEADTEPPDAEAQAFARAGLDAAAAYWNAGFERLKGCYQVKVQVDLEFTTEQGYGASEFEGFHVVRPWAHNSAGEFPDGRGLPTVAYPQVRAEDLAGDADTVYPFDHFSVGYLPEWTFEDPWALAHELGHFFGLGDDYRDGDVIPGREGTLMAGTEGADYIDQALLDSTLGIINEAGYELPECIEGTFLLDASSHFVEEPQDHDQEYSLRVEFTLKPAANGQLEGDGTSFFSTFSHDVRKNAGTADCESFLGPFETSWPVKTKGRYTGDILSFEVDPPSRSFDLGVTGSCGAGTVPYEVSYFGGWSGIQFTNGVYQYSADSPNVGGNTHTELMLTQK